MSNMKRTTGKRVKGPNGGRTASTYGAYVFTTKDPEIDALRTVFEDHFGHRITKKDCKSIERSGGPTAGCTLAWFFGKTKRPQNASLEAAGRSAGYQRKWIKMPASEVERIATRVARIAKQQGG